MVRSIFIHIIVFLYSMLCLEGYSYAGSQINPADLKDTINKHIEKVKFSNPQKYQKMIEKAGENPTDCTDCHTEIRTESLPLKRGMDSKGSFKK